MHQNELALSDDQSGIEHGWRNIVWLAGFFPAAEGAMLNRMACEETTRTYANKTGARLEPKERARARRKTKNSEGIQENSRLTKEYMELQRDTQEKMEY